MCSMFTFYYGILSAFAPNFIWILILRGLVGFGIGGVPQSYVWLLFLYLCRWLIYIWERMDLTIIQNTWAWGDPKFNLRLEIKADLVLHWGRCLCLWLALYLSPLVCLLHAVSYACCASQCLPDESRTSANSCCCNCFAAKRPPLNYSKRNAVTWHLTKCAQVEPENWIAVCWHSSRQHRGYLQIPSVYAHISKIMQIPNEGWS